jgi:DNA-directed RNA polymerase specialized sigma24 family protein
VNYFKAAEQVLSSVPDLERSLENLERRKERLLKEGTPRSAKEPDYEKPFVDVRYVNKTLTEALDLSECARCINRTRTDLDEIKRVIGQLPDELRRLVYLWYIEKRPRDRVMEELAISSPTTMYSKRNQAVGKFALLYYGSPALGSM